MLPEYQVHVLDEVYPDGFVHIFETGVIARVLGLPDEEGRVWIQETDLNEDEAPAETVEAFLEKP